MANKKQDAFYFSHDANARRDRKMMKMMSKYPYGYQFYFMTLEILREEANYKYPLSDIGILALELRQPEAEVKGWLEYCITECELFVKNEKFFWSEGFFARMKPLEKKRQQTKKAIKKRWDKYKENKEVNTDVLRTYNEIDTPVIQSKVKESKVKESKEEYIHTADDTFVWFWNLYDKKVGDKTKVAKKFLKLTSSDIEKIQQTLPQYIASTPDKTYRKHPMTYLNNRSWEDEIIVVSYSNKNLPRLNNLQTFES